MAIAKKGSAIIVKGVRIATNCQCCGCQPLPALPDSVEVDITRGQTGYATAVIGENPLEGPESPKFAFAVAWAFPQGTYVLSQYTGDSYRYEFPGNSGELFAIFDAGTNQSLQFRFRLPVIRSATFFDTSTPPTEEYLLADDFITNAECSGGNVGYHPKGDTTLPLFAVFRCSAPLANSIWLKMEEGCVLEVPYPRFIGSVSPGILDAATASSASGCAFPIHLSVTRSATLTNTNDFFLTTTDLSIHRNKILGQNSQYMYTFSAVGADGESFGGRPIATKTATCTIDSVRLIYGQESQDMFPPVGDSLCTY